MRRIRIGRALSDLLQRQVVVVLSARKEDHPRPVPGDLLQAQGIPIKDQGPFKISNAQDRMPQGFRTHRHTPLTT